MAKENEDKVVEAKATQAEPNKQGSVTFSLGTLSVILSLISLGISVLFKMLLEFGVNLWGAPQAIFFVIACGLSVFAAVLAWMNSKQKFTLSLGLAAFAFLITFFAL